MGLSSGYRRQFGAQTIDRLLTSILVIELLSGKENIWAIEKKKKKMKV
jgi:hypothetical protein